METARPVARFATHVFGVVPLRFQAGMGRGLEILHDRFVAGRAFFRTDKFRARDAGRRHDRVVRFEVAAGKQNES